MINADKVITFYHFDEDAEAWERSVHTASVIGKVNTVASKGEIVYDNAYTVRIPTNESMAIDITDRIYIGNIENDVPPDDNTALYVFAFADNRRGSPRMRHWRIDCK